MSRKNKNQVPATPVEPKVEDQVVKSNDAIDILPEGMYDEAVKRSLAPPATGEAGLEEFHEAVKSQIANITEGPLGTNAQDELKSRLELDAQKSFQERFDMYGNDFLVPVNENGEYVEMDEIWAKEDAEKELKSVVQDAATKMAMKRVFGIVEDHTVIDYNSVIQDHSTLLEYYQARKTVEGADLDFIPLDYVTLDEETGIVQNINFAFMIPFNVILGHINYITLKKDDFILGDNDVLGMPSRYDIIEHEATIEARFNVEGEYDVKTMFDESLTVLQSSLFSNYKVAK